MAGSDASLSGIIPPIADPKVYELEHQIEDLQNQIYRNNLQLQALIDLLKVKGHITTSILLMAVNVVVELGLSSKPRDRESVLKEMMSDDDN